MATDPSVRQGVRAVATTTTDPQRNEKRALAARGAAGALALSVLALVVRAGATATPTWGYYSNDHNVDTTVLDFHRELERDLSTMVYSWQLLPEQKIVRAILMNKAPIRLKVGCPKKGCLIIITSGPEIDILGMP
ncbi:hypothetical protein EAI_17247 [Harpegnathos saltator]|uniref:Uncharacterized protein n=1 Tax=Harpegnathos saltator TaxID=610380 RepID=E2B7Z8_HARSA|nr:hypothetical protein EAI_17247 [Harpegnathos saltator]